MPWPEKVRNNNKTEVYACEICGETTCQIEAWVDINTNEIMQDCGGSDIWCPTCETHDTTLVLVHPRTAKRRQREWAKAQAARPKCEGCGIPEGQGHTVSCRLA